MHILPTLAAVVVFIVLMTFGASAQDMRPGRSYAISLTRIVDGDTFYARRRGWLGPWGPEFAIRPEGYDSAETRGRRCQAELEAGRRAKEALEETLRLGRVWFTWSGRKHRDRFIGRVVVRGKSLSRHMVDHAMVDQEEDGLPAHSIPWIKGQTRRLEWFPCGESRR